MAQRLICEPLGGSEAAVNGQHVSDTHVSSMQLFARSAMVHEPCPNEAHVYKHG